MAILTGINIVAFFKLKQAGDQVMKMMFPGAKNMNEAMANMQRMMGGMGGFGGGAGGRDMSAQLKAAMNMLEKNQKGRRR